MTRERKTNDQLHRQEGHWNPLSPTNGINMGSLLYVSLLRLVATCFAGSNFERLMKTWDGGNFILWRFLGYCGGLHRLLKLNEHNS